VTSLSGSEQIFTGQYTTTPAKGREKLKSGAPWRPGQVEGMDGQYYSAPTPETKSKKYATPLDLVKQLYGLTPEQIKDLQQQLSDAGYGGSGLTVTGRIDLSTISAYESLLTDVYNEQQNGDADVTPQDWLSDLATQAKSSENASKASTQTSVNLSDPFTAQSILNSALSDLLGRDATADELSQFTAALTGAERANPTVTSQTGSGTSSDTTVSSTTSGGFDAEQFAQNWVKEHYGPEVNADKAAIAFGMIAKAFTGSPLGGA